MKYEFKNGTVEYVHHPKEKLWKIYPKDVRYYMDNEELIKEIFAELKSMGMEYGPFLQTQNPPYIIAWEVKP
jgi:hypothetical protein